MIVWCECGGKIDDRAREFRYNETENRHSTPNRSPSLLLLIQSDPKHCHRRLILPRRIVFKAMNDSLIEKP